MTTWAPFRAAPVESETVPRMRPVLVCATSGEHTRSEIAAKTASRTTSVRRRMWSPPRQGVFGNRCDWVRRQLRLNRGWLSSRILVWQLYHHMQRGSTGFSTTRVQPVVPTVGDVQGARAGEVRAQIWRGGPQDHVVDLG